MKNLLTFLMVLMLCYAVAIKAQQSGSFLDKQNLVRNQGSEKMDSNGKEFLPPWQSQSMFPVHFEKDGMTSKYRTGFRHQAASFNANPFSNKNQMSTTSSGVDTAWVRHYSSQIFGGAETATDMAIDDSGNVYVTGTSEGVNFGYDFATIKYNSAGVMQWEARYSVSENYLDNVSSLALDRSGNIIITGAIVMEGSGGWTNSNVITIKYNTDGVEQWVTIYDGSIGQAYAQDYASALAVDDAGNVYVTGYSSADTWQSYDYVTIKYNSSGIEQWVARYNGPGNGHDEPTAIVLDEASNVYVTGFSVGPGTDYNYATIKYNRDGIEQWIARYNSPANKNDEAVDLAVDGSGNVYVTGRSVAPGKEDSDFTTIKYDSNGVEKWLVRYNGLENSTELARALVIDDSNNVYVTGTSYTNPFPMSGISDYITVKYNNDGVEQWTARYSGQGNGMDWVTAIKIDRRHNVYVAGYSWVENSGFDYATVKYNSNGIEQWVARYDGPNDDDPQADYDDAIALAVDDAGNVYITGTVNSSFSIEPDRCQDYATVKYDSSGIEQWVALYNGPALDYNQATDLALDGIGNVYVTGYSTDLSEKNSDYVMIKYDAAGAVQWLDRYQEGNRANDLAVDKSGNVYVTGSGNDENCGTVTIKYTSSGTRKWIASSLECDAKTIAVDSYGNVYIAGEVMGDVNQNYAIIKYDSSGSEQWVASYDGPGNSYEYLKALAVDDSGNVYVTGISDYPQPPYSATIATVKYNTAGVKQWNAIFLGSGSFNDASGIAVDDHGNVYITGKTRFPVTGDDFVTIKYNAHGAEQWVARYNGSNNDWDEATALALDNYGNIYITGQSNGYATIKYNNAGEQQWVACFSSPGRSYDLPNDVAVDGSGNVYVTGLSIGSRDDADYTTIKYDASGIEQWIAQYNGPGNLGDEAMTIAIDAPGQVYVTGTSWGGNWSMMTTIKYTETGTPVVIYQEPAYAPVDFNLKQNYPNPFNPSTTIEFTLPKSAFVTLRIYNLLGEEVATLVAEQRLAGIHKFNWDARGLASGVYLYRMEAMDPLTGFPNKSGQAGQVFVQTKKLILMR